MKEKTLIVNLISVFVVGFALTTFLHEMAHAIVAKILNADPVLFHTYVSYDDTAVPQRNQLYIAAAGPLFSLFQSLLFLILLRRRTKIDVVAFLYVWMGIMGIVVFLGYIMIAPFVAYGDTGKVYAILSVPQYVSLPFTAIAMIFIIYFFRKITPVIGGLIFQLKTEMKYEHKKAVLFLFILPLVIGTILNILISLPAPTPVSLVFPMVISLTMIPSAIRLKDFILPSGKSTLPENDFSKRTYIPVMFMIFMILISRILAMGINL